MRAWSQAYRDDGLVVIGVHTPEFSFEHDIDGVRRATEERAIDYPVAVDNDYEIWSAFANRYWPALYFVDADGVIRDEHFGEGRYEQSERVIQRLLGVEREPGLRRRGRRGGGGRLGPPATRWRRTWARRATASRQRALPSNHWTLAGEWTVGPENVVLERRRRDASPSGSTRATRISCCRRERESRFPSACSSTARLQAGQQASTSTRTGPACSGTPACTSSCASTTPSASGRWRSRSSSRAPRRTRSPSGRTMSTHRIVIVGGGFGGLQAALGSAEGDRGDHAHRPAQLPPVPAADLPGRDRRPVARRGRLSAARGLQAQPQRARPARRGRALRPRAARGDPPVGRRSARHRNRCPTTR